MRAQDVFATTPCAPSMLAVMSVGGAGQIVVEAFGEFDDTIVFDNGGPKVSSLTINLVADTPITVAAAIKAAGYNASTNGIPAGMKSGKMTVVSGPIAWNTGGSRNGADVGDATAGSGMASLGAAPTANSGPPLGTGDVKYWGMYR